MVGLNPYMSNTDLWSIKTGRREAEDISDKPYVRYGHDAEPLLRELFKLDFPDYKVGYVDNNLFLNSRYPWAHASLDGWLQDPEGRTGILEIKTANIQNAAQKEKWQGQIPPSYFCQILHYLMVTEWDFAILSANVLMHQFCRVGSYTMVGGGTRFSQNVLPFSLVAREPAAFCGLNTIGLRRRGFDRDLINNIHMAYQIILQGTGKLNDLLARVEQEIPMSPEIEYILDFIRGSERGFIR